MFLFYITQVNEAIKLSKALFQLLSCHSFLNIVNKQLFVGNNYIFGVLFIWLLLMELHWVNWSIWIIKNWWPSLLNHLVLNFNSHISFLLLLAILHSVLFNLFCSLFMSLFTNICIKCSIYLLDNVGALSSVLCFLLSQKRECNAFLIQVQIRKVLTSYLPKRKKPYRPSIAFSASYFDLKQTNAYPRILILLFMKMSITSPYVEQKWNKASFISKCVGINVRILCFNYL